ncbi:Type III pantothenate kinase [Planctomycetales bacterium 10988]|nr:Type III pantothenate kinase [Planctomycetales bacterium 10988]
MSDAGSNKAEHGSARPLIAADLGNSRLKFGRYAQPFANLSAGKSSQLPEPESWLSLGPEESFSGIAQGLNLETPVNGVDWWIASVNQAATMQLRRALRQMAPSDGEDLRIHLLSHEHFPIKIELEQPDRVGKDRLAAATAANCLRAPDRAAIIVDLGTAITVDRLSAEGAFEGGAILAGLTTAAEGLRLRTDMLPRVSFHYLEVPPEPLGRSTIEAMRGGIFWGAVGAIRELIVQLQRDLSQEPDVFITGGASALIAKALGNGARHVPHLTLGGIVIAAKAACSQ